MMFDFHGNARQSLRFTYKNYRGEVAERTVIVHGIWWGKTEFHPELQWLMVAYDVPNDKERTFAMRDMTDVRALELGN